MQESCECGRKAKYRLFMNGQQVDSFCYDCMPLAFEHGVDWRIEKIEE